VPGHGIQVASLLDVAATKLATIQQRAQARDYEDLAAIVGAGVSLSEALAAATATYGSEFNGAQPKAHSAHRSQNRCKWAGRRASPRGARRLSRATLCEHLNGQITIGIYALNPRTQRSKWVAIDADYVGLAFLAAGGSLRRLCGVDVGCCDGERYWIPPHKTGWKPCSAYCSASSCDLDRRLSKRTSRSEVQSI